MKRSNYGKTMLHFFMAVALIFATVVLSATSLRAHPAGGAGLRTEAQHTAAPAWRGLQGLAGIDDIAVYNPQLLLVFKGSRYYRYQIESETLSEGASLASLPGWPGSWAGGIDAAVEWDASTILLFKGNQYVRYLIATQAIADTPIALRNWPGWPDAWISGIDAAARLDTRTLVFFPRRPVYRL